MGLLAASFPTQSTPNTPALESFLTTGSTKELLDTSPSRSATTETTTSDYVVTTNLEELITERDIPDSKERPTMSTQSTDRDDNPALDVWFSKFIKEFKQIGKRAILLGIVERDRAGSTSSTEGRLDLPVKTSQQLDSSRLTFKASAGDAVATLFIDSNVNKKSVVDIEKPVTAADMSTVLHRTKRTTGETYYRITEYQYAPNEDGTEIDSSSAYTTRPPVEMPHNNYRSYLDTGYEDEKCRPESVMLNGDGDSYLPDVVPGVRCNANCSACKDGYLYQAVIYPIPTLKVHKIDTIQTYYKTTRFIPVYCACFKIITDDDAIYREEDSSSPYEAFESVETGGVTKHDPSYNAEDADDLYDAFDSTSTEYRNVAYNAEEADGVYDAFEPVPSQG